jgi:Tol biopolymer transport system component
MPKLDDYFRALTKVRPPNEWPALGEHAPGPPTPLRTPLGRRLAVAALALAVAGGGVVFAARAFLADRAPQPAAPVDNGLIAFSRLGPEAGLYVMNPDGSQVRRLTSEKVDSSPAWSPDGSSIAFVRGFWDPDAGIYVMDADGSNLRRLTDGGWGDDRPEIDPAWLPTGTRIAFAQEGANTDIYTVSSDGTGLARLTDSPAMEYQPAWSPNGSKIAFVGYDMPPGPVRLYVMNADGTGVTELGPENVDGPSWSPEGAEIAYGRHQVGLDHGDPTGWVRTAPDRRRGRARGRRAPRLRRRMVPGRVEDRLLGRTGRHRHPHLRREPGRYGAHTADR